jgi:hypothetical protein
MSLGERPAAGFRGLPSLLGMAPTRGFEPTGPGAEAPGPRGEAPAAERPGHASAAARGFPGRRVSPAGRRPHRLISNEREKRSGAGPAWGKNLTVVERLARLPDRDVRDGRSASNCTGTMPHRVILRCSPTEIAVAARPRDLVSSRMGSDGRGARAAVAGLPRARAVPECAATKPLRTFAP